MGKDERILIIRMPRSLTCKSAVRMPEWRVAEQFLCLSDILLFLGGLVNLNKKKKIIVSNKYLLLKKYPEEA